MEIDTERIENLYSEYIAAKTVRVRSEISFNGMKFTIELARASLIATGIEGKNADERKAKLDLEMSASDKELLSLEQELQFAKLKETVAQLRVEQLKQEIKVAEIASQFEMLKSFEVESTATDTTPDN